MQERWLLWLPVGMAAGIVLYFSLPFEPPLALVGISPFFGLGCWIVRRFKKVVAGALVVLAISVGFNAAQLETRFNTTPMIDYDTGPLQVSGRLMHAETVSDGVRLTLQNLTIGNWPSDRTPVKLWIDLKNKALDDLPEPGTVIDIWAQLGPLNEPVIPGGYDTRRQNYFDQVGGLGWSSSIPNLEQDSETSSSWLDRPYLAFEKVRLTLIQHIRARLPEETANLLIAHLNGGQLVSEQTEKTLHETDLAYVLSYKGFHVIVIGLLVYIPLQALLALFPWITLRLKRKEAAAIAAIIWATAYAILIGAQSAALSLLVLVLVVPVIVLDRRHDPMRLLMIIAALILGVEPASLLGPSFQISFAAIFCLIAARSQLVDKSLHEASVKRQSSHRFLHGMGRALYASLIATAAAAPFVVYYVQAFSIYSFLSNLIVILLTSFWIMPCIFMAYLTLPFGSDGWFLDGAGVGAGMTLKIADTISHLPFSVIFTPTMPVGLLLMASAGGLWIGLMQQRWRYLGFIPLGLALLYPLYTAQPDFIVAADGQEWAARLKDGRLAVADLNHDAFEISQWQKSLGNPMLVDVSDLPDTEKQLRCDDVGCVYHHDAENLAMPHIEAAAFEDCDRATIIVAPFVVKSCAASKIIDDSQFWAHGAQSIYFEAHAFRTAHVRPRRGLRPWSPGWKGNMDKDQGKAFTATP